jgi:GT2 family glycosyltransferase
MAPVRPSAVKPVAHPVSAADATERHLKDLLQTVNGLIRAGDFDRALRVTDRVWRHAREDGPITRLYARLLARAGEHGPALRLLAAAAETQSDPDTEAQIVECLLAGGNTDAAAARLDAALRRFCLEPDGPLAEAARRVVARQAAGCRGWIGRAPALELVGAVRDAPQGARLELRADGVCVARADLTARAGEPATFCLAPLRQAYAALAAVVGGVPLLGSGLADPPDFALDGRATVRNGQVSGWVRLGWRPSAPLELVLEDEHGTQTRIASAPDGGARGRRSFALDPAAAGLRGNQIFISAVLPDGTVERLPDAPLLLERAVPPVAAAKTPRPVPLQPAQRLCPRPVAIIVPVYLGRDDTMRALAALRATLRRGDEAIVIDDASPDPTLVQALDGLAASGAITLLRNERNLGFAATVNRGLALRPDRDAILLNADTVVFGDWIDRLQRTASQDEAIGTVTPLTNRGAIASYPGGEEGDCTSAEAAALDRIAAAVNQGIAVDLPVGVGFCLYLRRDCLADTGAFDAATFGKGYGEENDFCLRAGKRGWRHVLAGDVFVHHAGGRSFGRRAAALRERNRRLLNLRHPGYDALVEDFVAADPARPLRRRLDEARLRGADERHALLLTLDLPGGVERQVRERCRVLGAAGLTPLLLRPNTAGGCRIVTEDGRYGDLAYAIPDELPALQALLAAARIAHVELHHFLDHDRRVVEAVIALGVPYDVHVHDYVWICPRVGLVDGAGRYCGEPSTAACEACVTKNGSSLGEAISVRDLRRRSARWLGGARAVTVPCTDVATRLARYFPALKPRVVPWEETPAAATPPALRPGPVRIALIGAIGEHKGYRLLRECAADAAARALPLEFVVLGYSEDDQPLIDTGKVFVTGRYEEPELPELLRRERPNLLFFPSVTPETWCFALTEAIRSGVPIAALAHGALAERLGGSATSILLPVDADARQVNDRLLAAARAGNELRPQKPAFALPLQSTNLTAVPAQEFEHMDKTDRSPPVTRENTISGSVEVITIPKGQYRFTVKAGAPARAKGAGVLAVPAVHVGLGPGMAPSAASITPKKRSNGTWLFEPGDTLVAKISSAGATLVLTSVRAPGGQALAIEVERLEGKRGAPAVLPSAAAPAEPASLRTEILAHVRNRGDMTFADVEWAGRVGPGLWIEAFAVKPLEGIAAADIEYKGLTRTGIETPWIGSGGLCGTRGMSVALIGFAARLKPEAGANYDCEYTGYFQSGTTVGPLKNGAPCRSSVPNDPLEGIRLRLVARTGSAAAAPTETRVAVRRGPQFSKFREEITPADTPRPSASPAPAKRGAKAKPRKGAAAAPRRAKPAPPRKRAAAARRQAAP